MILSCKGLLSAKEYYVERNVQMLNIYVSAENVDRFGDIEEGNLLGGIRAEWLIVDCS
jgi:hypothetical protein